MPLDPHEALELELRERIAFLESREVCAAAHDNVETCGYCQRDAMAFRLDAYMIAESLAYEQVMESGRLLKWIRTERVNAPMVNQRIDEFFGAPASGETAK
jgi:hypothetical protein